MNININSNLNSDKTSVFLQIKVWHCNKREIIIEKEFMLYDNYETYFNTYSYTNCITKIKTFIDNDIKKLGGKYNLEIHFKCGYCDKYDTQLTEQFKIIQNRLNISGLRCDSVIIELIFHDSSIKLEYSSMKLNYYYRDNYAEIEYIKSTNSQYISKIYKFIIDSIKKYVSGFKFNEMKSAKIKNSSYTNCNRNNENTNEIIIYMFAEYTYNNIGITYCTYFYFDKTKIIKSGGIDGMIKIINNTKIQLYDKQIVKYHNQIYKCDLDKILKLSILNTINNNPNCNSSNNLGNIIELFIQKNKYIKNKIILSVHETEDYLSKLTNFKFEHQRKIYVKMYKIYYYLNSIKFNFDFNLSMINHSLSPCTSHICLDTIMLFERERYQSFFINWYKNKNIINHYNILIKCNKFIKYNKIIKIIYVLLLSGIPSELINIMMYYYSHLLFYK